jgi:hypothetical protein
MKRTLKKIALWVTALSAIVLLVDVFLFRGIFLAKLVKSKEFRKQISATANMSYKIEKSDQTYVLTFENNSLQPYYFWTYRFEELIQEIPDSIFFSYAGRMQIFYPYFTTKLHYGFDCGTGVGMTAVRPLESFEIRKSYFELLGSDDYLYDHFEDSHPGDTIAQDLYHQKPLISLIDNKFKLLENPSIQKTDSVSVSFYLPVFSPLANELSYIQSNTIKFSYHDMVSEITKGTEERAKYD